MEIFKKNIVLKKKMLANGIHKYKMSKSTKFRHVTKNIPH